MKAGLGAAVVGASWLTRSGAASAAGDIETLVAAAKAEGEVTIYHVLPEGPSKKIAETFTAKYGISNLKFYLNGQNLFTFSKMKDFDPEKNINGVNFYEYPTVKIYTAGINVTF